MLAFPDIVYDCHHQVEYVSGIVAYARLSELTGIERSMPTTSDAFYSSSFLFLHRLAFFRLHTIRSPSLHLPTLALPNGLLIYTSILHLSVGLPPLLFLRPYSTFLW
jgi:hypothetical protein